MIDEKAVFSAARQIDQTVERERYLEEACRGEPEALRRVQELLRIDERAQSFLESPAVAPFESRDAAPLLESAGSVIGPYRLLEQIGEGGCGVVFMAEQTQPVRRRVALKVIKPGMDTRQVIARFEAERQALALMDHPNIARIFDAGTTATGRPYFVMELVRGVPITEYCDEHHLTPRERLDLFVAVCHAVQHAHQKGIIHRDLKPTNVLVTQHDDRPVAKVIDFGIAKATSGALTDRTLFTGFAQLVGTPLYMSPEQASLNALDVDTRSDIYSLGVLLYELLAGEPPFDKARLQQAAFDEIRRIIREEEPARPSARLSTSDALPTLAANRGTEPAKLTRLVRGDLDWIVMKALEKDRSRRYETANGVAMDVQRYLADEAVLARPPSLGYRLRKFVRRNRGAVAATAVVGALLFITAASLGWMARESAVRRARNAESVAALLAQAEDALRAERTEQATIALEAAEQRAADGGAEELEGRLARIRADQVLLRELDAIDTFHWTWVNDAQPSPLALAARWRAALARYGIRPAEGRAEEAAGRVNRSLIRDRLLTVLDLWLSAERTADVRGVLRAADPDPYRDAVRDAVTRLPSSTTSDASALIALAAQPEALAQPARFAAVLGLYHEVSEDRRRVVLETALRIRPGDLRLLMDLGGLYKRVKHVTGSVEARSEWVRWYQAAVAAHPGVVVARNELGIALFDRGDLDGALACYVEAIRLDPMFPYAHWGKGMVFDAKGEWDRAVASYEEAIRVGPNLAGPHYNLGIVFYKKRELASAIASYEEAIRLDPTLVVAHCNLGVALRDKGELSRAIERYETALQIDPTVAGVHINLGDAFLDKRDPDRAIACYEEAIRLDPTDVAARCGLGRAFEDRGELDRAIACFEEAIRLNPDHVPAHNGLGVIRGAKGELDRAIACFEEAIRLDPNYALGHRNLGNAFREKGDSDRAIGCYEKAIRLDPTCVGAHLGLGNVLYARGELDKAIAFLEAAVRLDAKNAEARNNLGGALAADGHPEKAIPCFEKAIELDPNLAMAYKNLGFALSTRGQEGDLQNAVERFRKAIQLDPTDATIHNTLGVTYRKMGNLDEAIASYQDAIRLTPKDPRPRGNLGRALLAKRDTAGAIDCFREAIELDPSRAKGHYDLAEALVVVGNDADAAAAYAEAIRLDPRFAGAHNGLGVLHKRRGHLEEAIESFRDAIQHDQTNWTLHKNLGSALLDKGDSATAVDCLEKAIECIRGEDRTAMFECKGLLAEAYGALDRHADALVLRKELLDGWKSLRGPNDRMTLGSMNNLANCYTAIGRHEEALALLEETFALMKAAIPDDVFTLNAMNNLANSYFRSGRHEEALALREETLALMKAKVPDQPSVLYVQMNVVDSLLHFDRGAEAIPLIDEVVRRGASLPALSGQVSRAIDLRLRHFQKKREASGCRETVETWELLNRTDAQSVYDAACYWAVTAAVRRASDASEDAAREAAAEADRAMDRLGKAVAAGYGDFAHMERDADLDALRDREDFRALLSASKPAK